MRKQRYDPARHHRRSIRLKGYDYTLGGAYFITVCTQNRACLFGHVRCGEMHRNDAGDMIQSTWDELAAHYPGVEIDEFIVMANHIHGIVVLTGAPADGVADTGRPVGTAVTLGLPDVVHRLKTLTTSRYCRGVTSEGWQPFDGRLWQRNYYDHIIRTERSLENIRQYIADNPLNWDKDSENPDRPR